MNTLTRLRTRSSVDLLLKGSPKPKEDTRPVATLEYSCCHGFFLRLPNDTCIMKADTEVEAIPHHRIQISNAAAEELEGWGFTPDHIQAWLRLSAEGAPK